MGNSPSTQRSAGGRGQQIASVQENIAQRMEEPNIYAAIEDPMKSARAGILGKIGRVMTLLSSHEARLKKVFDQCENTKKSKAASEQKVTELEEKLIELDATMKEHLEAAGITSALNNLRAEMDFLEEKLTPQSILPSCPVCFEECDPSNERNVCCCPEGHPICGRCAGRVSACPTCRRAKSSFGGAFTRMRELERHAGKTLLDEKAIPDMVKKSELAAKLKSLEKRKEDVEAANNAIKAVFKEELERAETELSAASQRLKSIQARGKSFADILENTVLKLNLSLSMAEEVLNENIADIDRLL